MLTWIWILIAFVILVIVLCAADYFLGKKNYRNHNLKREYSNRKGNIHLITQGKELFSLLFADIKEANSSIHILFFIVKNDQISTQFLQLLKHKAQEGVEVRLLLDWVGSHSVSKSLIKQLKKVGAEIVFCHRPRLPFLFFTLQQRNHRKIAIIDGKIGYLGGYNVGKEYIDGDPVLTPWRDYHLRILGESIQDLQHEFFVNWRRSTGESHFKEKKYFPNLEEGKMLHRFLPTEGLRLEEALCNVINNAKETIYIGTPYFIPSQRIFQTLIHALQRGVEINIIVPEKADHFLVKEAAFRYFRKLIANGAKVYQYLNGFYHGKVVIADHEVCQIGTANFDRRSFFLNHECNCLIYDYDFIKKMIEVVEKDIRNSHLMAYEELMNTSFITKVKEQGARVVTDLL